MALAILLFSILFSIPINGEQKKIGDPYITCPGNWVPDNANGLPSGYFVDHYADVMQLCSALNGNSRNVGCVCSSSQESSFHCYRRLADRLLFHAVITSSLKPFPTFCRDSCFCTDVETAAMDRTRVASEPHYIGTVEPEDQENYFDPGDSSYQINSHGSAAGGAYGIDPEGTGNEWNGEETLDQNPVPTSVAVAHGQCWANCTSNADCLKGGEKGCICSTQKEQYQPGRGTVAFVAACIISMSGAGGKREEARPCPCNATYVSHSCCGVSNGLVWEEERFKLGELVIEHGL